MASAQERFLAPYIRSAVTAGARIAAFMSVLLLCSGCGLSGYGAQDAEPRVPVYHRIQPGDTVWGISQRYKVKSEQVLLLNGIDDPEQLAPGSRILVGYRYPNRTTATIQQQQQHRTPPRRSDDRSAPAQSEIIPVSQRSGALSNRTQQQNGDLWWPLGKGRIVSTFGPRNGSFHDGIDISSPEGTPVYAAHSGVVVYAGNKLSGYGNLIVLRHASGLTTVYAHNSKMFVSTGDKIHCGENISLVGSTGHSSGPHLHFEVRTRDRKDRYVAVDPLPLLNGEADARPRYRVNEGLAPILARLFE